MASEDIPIREGGGAYVYRPLATLTAEQDAEVARLRSLLAQTCGGPALIVFMTADAASGEEKFIRTTSGSVDQLGILMRNLMVALTDATVRGELHAGHTARAMLRLASEAIYGAQKAEGAR